MPESHRSGTRESSSRTRSRQKPRVPLALRQTFNRDASLSELERLRSGELDSGELAERPPLLGPVAWVEHLVGWAAEPQPLVHARAQPAGRAEEAVGHLERRQLVGVEDLALDREQPELLAAERDQRGERGRAGRVLEQERRRLLHPADPQRSLDQPDAAVGPRERPVALA